MAANKLFLKTLLVLISITSITLAGIGNSTTKIYPKAFFNGNKIQGSSTAIVTGTDKVVDVKFTSHTGLQLHVYAGTLAGKKDGNNATFYCVDISHVLATWTHDQPFTYTDSGNTSPQITYILNNYYPFKPFPYAGSLPAVEKEAASVQMAIWHFSDTVDVTTLDNHDISTRAQTIINDATLHAGNIVTIVITPITPILDMGTPGQFYVTALDQNNQPLSGVTITLTSTTGTLDHSSAITGAGGTTGNITLTPGPTDTLAVITAKVSVTVPQGTIYKQSYITPDNFQKLVLATPTTTTLSATSNITWMHGSIGDFVWNDVNGNGIQDANELGIPNVIVQLYKNNISFASTATNTNGKYLFSNLTAGNYYVQFTATPGYTISLANQGGNSALDSNPDATGKTGSITLVAGQSDLTIDAGMYLPASIGDFVWNDVNGNGIQDANELGIPNVIVQLYKNNISFASTATNTNGKYLFSNLTAGNYYVQFTATPGYTISLANQGGNSALDSNPDATGKTGSITLTAGQSDLTIDAGMYLPGSIGNFVWNDANHNGIQDDGNASGISGVIVQLYNFNNNNLIATTATTTNGAYLFSNLTAGNYYVQFTATPGYTLSPAGVGTDRTVDSNPDATGKTGSITLTAGQSDLTIDAGMYLPAPPPVLGSIGDFVWNDINQNGIQDADEPGISGVIVKLYDNNNNLIRTTTTNSSGIYSFINLTAGSYYVQFVATAGYTTFSPATQGGNTALDSNPDATGKTSSITLAAGQSDLTIDAGMYSSTSGSGNGGAESKGTLSEHLLNRLLKIERGQTPAVLAKSKYGTITGATSLQSFIPMTGPFNSVSVETTPFDILGISNAVSAYAADYMMNINPGTKRVASIFSTITAAPNIYDHSKAVCDRLAGDQLSSLILVTINGKQFYAAQLTSPGTTDYAISFSIYETPGAFNVENKWTYNEYIAPNNATSVYNFQVWSSSINSTISLVENILASASAIHPLVYMNNNQMNPVVYIKNAVYSQDGNIHLTIVNNTAASSQVGFNTMYRVSQADDQLQSQQTSITVNAGETSVVLNPGIISDAQVYMADQSGFKDEVYVSGGAYTYNTGTTSTISTFGTTGYPQGNASQYPNGSLILAGGVNVSGQLNDWISVVRSLNASASVYNLSGFNGITFKASGVNKVTVFIDIDGIQNYNYFAKIIDVSPTQQTFTLKFSDFSQLYGNQIPFDASKIRYFGFIIDKNLNPGVTAFNFEVQDIAFLNGLTGNINNSTSPVNFTLSQNYPNPFNPSTMIAYALPSAEKVVIKIYDLMGREVRSLINEEKNAGKYSVAWNGRNNNGSMVSSGVYLYKINAGNFIETKKMTLLK